MKVDFLSQAGKLLKEQKQYRRRLIVFLCLAVVVVYGTLTALKLYGQAMTHKMEVLDCQYEVHEHTDECYEMDEEGNLGTEPVCGYADYVIHVHNDDCYDADGNLTCDLEEHPAHEHTEECYVTEMVLVCGEEAQEDTEADTESSVDVSEGSSDAESSAADEESAEAPDSEESVPEASEPQEPEIICGMEEHVHDDSCLGQVLVCTQEGHEHTVECVDGDGNVICGKEEHVHDGNCQDAEGNIICGQEEHRHIIVCYDEDGNEICGKAVHTHDDSCRDAEGNIICGMEEHEHIVRCYQEGYICGTEEHTHTEACYAQEEAEGESTEAGAAEPEESTAPAEQESSAESKESSEAGTESSVETAGHVHTDECYEEVKTLICGEQELHTHDDSCYDEECFDEDGNLIEGSRPSCGLLQLEEHVHTKECFKTIELTPEEVAALENGAKLHIHTEECYDEEGNLICGHDATHIHQPECYDDTGKLICGYGAAVHVHEDKCYDEEGKLICGYETATHLHEESCYDADGNLQCGYETASHVHGKECYDEEGKLTCGYEAAAHVHEDSCYDAEGNLICGYGTILDTEDTVKLEGTFTYEAEDYTLEIHVETDIPSESVESDASVESTTDEEPAGTDAGTEEKTESSSEAQASGTEESSSTEPTEAESQPVTDDSAEEPGQEADASGIEELSEVQEGDTDTTVPETEESQDGSGDASEETDAEESEGQPEQDAQILLADENSGLTLKMIPLAAETEIHTEMASYVDGIGGSKLLDLSVMELHVYRDGKEIDISDCAVAVNITPKAVTAEEMIEAYGEEAAAEEGNGIIVSALQETAEGVQGSGNVFLTPDMEEIPVLQNAVAENGVLAIARYVNNETFTKTFQGESFIVTAAYRSYANIPAEAELIAELITEESDSEHYAKRQAEYQEALGDETATMQALMKIGFYVEDENGEFTQEVEPGSPVTITIQFLDEDGLAEGKPITVIHFAEEGTEMLEGSKVQDGSTTFRMESFSEIAVGYSVKNVKVPVNTTIDYDMDALHITFHIEGELAVPIDRVKNSDIDGQLADSGSEIAEESQNDVSHEDVESFAEIEDEEDSFPIEDGNTFIIPIEGQNLEKNLEFKVEALSEDSEEYANAVAGADSISEADEILLLDVLSYSLVYDEEELDLSDCTVTIEIAPTQMLIDYTEEVGSIATLELDEQLSQEDLQPEVVITALKGQSEGAISEIMDAMVVNSDTANESISFVKESEDGNNIVAVAVTMSQANPPFHVEYWAYLDRTVIGGVRLDDGSKGGVPANAKKDLDVIDTDGNGVPKNGEPLATTKIFLDATGNVISEEKLTQVYSKRDYEYILAPNLAYFDALLENESYVLKEVWVLNHDHDKDMCYQKGELICDKSHEHEWGCYEQTLKCEYANPSTIPDNQWIKHFYWRCGQEHEHTDQCQHLRFTNRRETAEGEDGSEYILISWDKTIRLVYDTTTKNGNLPSNFYDYDISNGAIRTNGDAKIITTGAEGINSTINCSEDVKYAFGNNNAGTNYGTKVWNGNNLNMFNKAGNGFQGCTFELVSKTDRNKDVVFNVAAPVVFGEGKEAEQKGKTIFTQYGLDFKQEGDTYTLIGVSKKEGDVSKTVTGNLDKFVNTTDDIWSNNFWPMDDASTWGASGHDMKFGNSANQDNLRFEPGDNKWKALPVSDDGIDHNSYFGMHFAVTFELTEEYVGPLEYLFFGDDDMWVFLDDEKLVCDIGGVHSSVGEYVNLWDYLPKGSSGKHTLKFFYTERGASGSSCWMQFTLPSVTGFEPSQGYGELKIEKTAENFEAGKDFSFDIAFSDASGNPLRNDYAYTKYQRTFEEVDGVTVEGSKAIENDIIIWNGGHFTLKDNEYIVITFLPIGTKYTITETGSDNCYTDIVVNGTKKENLTADKVAEGSVGSEDQGQVSYRNYKAYELPETGGSGTVSVYAMAGVIVLLGGAGFLYKKKFRERRA